MADCLFCRIIRGEVPSKKVYEDEYTYAFEDLNPQGPTHVLVIPKKHVAGLKEAGAEDAELVGRCHLAARSEERRVGKECRSRWSPYHSSKRRHTRCLSDWSSDVCSSDLVIPKKHVAGLKEAGAEDAELVGRCHLAAARIARERSIEDGYRTVLNVGPRAGQSVFHLHVHLIGGRPLQWPPG